jgi:hypothetical protein
LYGEEVIFVRRQEKYAAVALLASCFRGMDHPT